MAQRHEKLGQRIRQARDEREWKQKQLAAAVHVEPVTVSRWERGEHAPDISMLALIAGALEKPLSYFLSEATPAFYPEHVPNERLSSMEGRIGALEVGLSEALHILRELREHRGSA